MGMKTLFLKTMASVLLAVFAASGAVMPLAAQAATAREINQHTQEALSEFKTSVRDANEVLAKARGLLIFPHVYQAGIIAVGAEYGEGALLINGKTQGYYNIVSGSYGFQLGAQRKSIILAFMNDESLKEFRQSAGWKIGGDAGVTVVAVGAEGSINTQTLNKPILAFIVDQKGLMYNLSLEGSKITKINK